MLPDPTRNDPTNKHCFPPSTTTRTLMRCPAARKRTQRRPLTPLKRPGTAVVGLIPAARGRPQALKPHHFIPIRNTPRMVIPGPGLTRPGITH
ncbi:hypothetical protein HanRHA438_Chr17g0811271 [Helianthus annuus]|nr:hypothetical protein HanRHA438_Chr17g0811271 [Helianthus annuus]